jgi:hypothetical protein
MNGAYSLRVLRKLAFGEDRDTEALRPTAEVAPAPCLTRDKSPLTLALPQVGSKALEDLTRDLGDHGADAALIAVWSAASNWFGRHTNTWGHPQASVMHSDAANRIKGKPELLTSYPDDRQAEYHREALLALTAWEAAGSPGLLEKIQATREWVLKITTKKGGPNGSDDQTKSKGQRRPQPNPRSRL